MPRFQDRTQDQRLAEVLSQIFGAQDEEAYRRRLEREERQRQRSFYDLAFDSKPMKAA